MPPLAPVTGVVKLELIGNLGGVSQFANIFHFGGGVDPWSGSDLFALWGGIDSALQELYQGNGGTAMTVTEAILTDLTSDTGSSLDETIDWVGTRDGISPPASAAVLGKYFITRRYRGGHPRTYFPFGSVGLMLNPVSWDTTFIANVAANLESVRLAASAFSESSLMGCVSYFSGGVRRETPLFEPFISSTCEAQIRSQRRRLTSTTP